MINFIDDSYLDKLGAVKNGEYREYLGEKVLDLLNARLANRVMELLDDSQLNEMISTPDNRKMSWLEKNVPNFENIIGEELESIIVDMKAVMP